MTAHLPPALLSLFAPRPSIPFMEPIEKRPPPLLTGLSNYLSRFETTAPPPPSIKETPNQKRERIQKEREEKNKSKIETLLGKWDPSKDPNINSDPYRTLFVGRLNFSTSEHKLKREFEIYGAIKKVRVVVDKKGKPRGYAFIEFERERDMKAAYRSADGKKIDGKRIIVDVERGRLSRNWKPRSLGGGLGFTRKGSDEVNQKHSGRENQEGNVSERFSPEHMDSRKVPSYSDDRRHFDNFREERKDKERDSHAHDRYRGREGRDRERRDTHKSSSSNRRERSRDRG